MTAMSLNADKEMLFLGKDDGSLSFMRVGGIQ